MKLKKCKECYYGGREKCFFYDKSYEELNIIECKEGFLDPYTEHRPGEICKNCWYYKSQQCLGNKLAKEQCIQGYF